MTKYLAFNRVEGLNEMLRRLPPTLAQELRYESFDIAQVIVDDARQRAMAFGVARYVAPTIKVKRDRVPIVRMGGSGKLPVSGSWGTRSRSGSRQTVGDVIWGAEFGGGARKTTRQFGMYQDFWNGRRRSDGSWTRHRSGVGRFLYPAMREHSPYARARYLQALDNALTRAAQMAKAA